MRERGWRVMNKIYVVDYEMGAATEHKRFNVLVDAEALQELKDAGVTECTVAAFETERMANKALIRINDPSPITAKYDVREFVPVCEILDAMDALQNEWRGSAEVEIVFDVIRNKIKGGQVT